MIAGLIATGAHAQRASALRWTVPGGLEDPYLKLFDKHGVALASKNSWKDTQQSDIEGTGIPPSKDVKSANRDLPAARRLHRSRQRSKRRERSSRRRSLHIAVMGGARCPTGKRRLVRVTVSQSLRGGVRLLVACAGTPQPRREALPASRKCACAGDRQQTGPSDDELRHRARARLRHVGKEIRNADGHFRAAVWTDAPRCGAPRLALWLA